MAKSMGHSEYRYIILIILTICISFVLIFYSLEVIRSGWNSNNSSSSINNSETNKPSLLNKPKPIKPDALESPIRKYFTTPKIIWTFDDYWINSGDHPPHKGFDGLSQQIHTYGGYVNINCPFIPQWIDEYYGDEIRNYSVVKEFALLTSGFTQDHINLSLEFFNRSYISPSAHAWNHSENLNHVNLSLAYKIVNFTLWNWYNNYHIKPHFWYGPGDEGNYNVSLALKRFSETYWNVYAEGFPTGRKDCFPNGTSPAVEYIGESCDPYFGCSFGDPCTSLQEAQQLFTNYSRNREIVFIRGHPDILNDSSHIKDLQLWQGWIDWIYKTHELININHTQAIEYKIDRNNFKVEKNNDFNYTIDLTLCQFNHTILFSPPNNEKDQWILFDENENNIGTVDKDVFFSLEKGCKYYFSRLIV